MPLTSKQRAVKKKTENKNSLVHSSVTAKSMTAVIFCSKKECDRRKTMQTILFKTFLTALNGKYFSNRTWSHENNGFEP